MIKRDGDRIYTHVVWAEEVKALVNVLDDAKGHLIPQFRCNLPLTIRLILPENLTTWSTFLTAVTSISMDRIADQREKTETIRSDILQTMGIGNQQPQQHNVNALATRLGATNFYSPVCQSPAQTPKTPTTQTNPTTPSTTRQLYVPTQQWNSWLPATPKTHRFNQPVTSPSGLFLSSNSTI